MLDSPIRHLGVTVVDDLAGLAAYGLEESAWAQGFVRGFLDADFLVPLPARSGFEENEDWVAVLDLLDATCRRSKPSSRATWPRIGRARRRRSANERYALRATFSTSMSFATLRYPAAWRDAAGRPHRRRTCPHGRAESGAPAIRPRVLVPTRHPAAIGFDTRNCRSSLAPPRIAASCPVSSRPTRCILTSSRRRDRLTHGWPMPRS